MQLTFKGFTGFYRVSFEVWFIFLVDTYLILSYLVLSHFTELYWFESSFTRLDRLGFTVFTGFSSFITFLGLKLVLLGFHGFPWVINRCNYLCWRSDLIIYWFLPSLIKGYWDLPSFTSTYQARTDGTWFYLILPRFSEFIFIANVIRKKKLDGNWQLGESQPFLHFRRFVPSFT